MITQGSTFSLSQFKEQGYSGPVQGLSLEEAESGYNHFFEVLGQSKHSPGAANVNLSAWHHRYRWAYALATHPSIVDSISAILGEDVVLWAMHFWYKEPGNEKYIPWHQDIHYWPMEPAINATAWVSLGFSIQENGCLRIIPGTHKEALPHVDLGDGASAFGQGIAAEHIDESKAIEVEMSPGQIVFFNEAILHGSNSNASNIPRVAFSVRYTTPEVKFKMEDWGTGSDRIRTYLVRGEDRFHLNDDIIGKIPAK